MWQVAEVPGASAQPSCTHLETADPALPEPLGCAECLLNGGRWVHLRQCLSCGHLGCCDSSPGRHAYAHARPGHDVGRPLEQGATWAWCYTDEVFLGRAD